MSNRFENCNCKSLDEVLSIATKEMVQKEEEFTMSNNTNIMEGIKNMKTDDAIKTVVSNVAEKVKDAKVKIVSAGKANIDSLSKSCDEEISTLTTVLNKTVKAVAVGTADPELGEELANIFARLMSTNSIKSAIDAGRAADEAVFDWYKRLSLIDPDHVTFKEAWAFTREIGLDENGEPVNQFRGVFTILLGGLNWIACWLVKKCHVALESIGEIGKAIGFAVATVFGVAKALLKLAIKIATFVVVNGITAIISICAAIVNTIKKVGSKILSKKEQEELDDLEDDLDFEDDFLEDDFEEYED